MKSKVTAAELAKIAGVTAGLVQEYAKELRKLVPEEELSAECVESSRVTRDKRGKPCTAVREKQLLLKPHPTARSSPVSSEAPEVLADVVAYPRVRYQILGGE
ncbi:MAG: hypothetical protein JRM77_07260 [Nitrososphaerota archaeon]|nr:hypothetical protein [Nitrososphaerota archaeon]